MSLKVKKLKGLKVNQLENFKERDWKESGVFT